MQQNPSENAQHFKTQSLKTSLGPVKKKQNKKA